MKAYDDITKLIGELKSNNVQHRNILLCCFFRQLT